jgi:hypothetical protein
VEEPSTQILVQDTETVSILDCTEEIIEPTHVEHCRPLSRTCEPEEVKGGDSSGSSNWVKVKAMSSFIALLKSRHDENDLDIGNEVRSRGIEEPCIETKIIPKYELDLEDTTANCEVIVKQTVGSDMVERTLINLGGISENAKSSKSDIAGTKKGISNWDKIRAISEFLSVLKKEDDTDDLDPNFRNIEFEDNIVHEECIKSYVARGQDQINLEVLDFKVVEPQLPGIDQNEGKNNRVSSTGEGTEQIDTHYDTHGHSIVASEQTPQNDKDTLEIQLISNHGSENEGSMANTTKVTASLDSCLESSYEMQEQSLYLHSEIPGKNGLIRTVISEPEAIEENYEIHEQGIFLHEEETDMDTSQIEPVEAAGCDKLVKLETERIQREQGSLANRPAGGEETDEYMMTSGGAEHNYVTEEIIVPVEASAITATLNGYVRSGLGIPRAVGRTVSEHERVGHLEKLKVLLNNNSASDDDMCSDVQEICREVKIVHKDKTQDEVERGNAEVILKSEVGSDTVERHVINLKDFDHVPVVIDAEKQKSNHWKKIKAMTKFIGLLMERDDSVKLDQNTDFEVHEHCIKQTNLEKERVVLFETGDKEVVLKESVGQVMVEMFEIPIEGEVRQEVASSKQLDDGIGVIIAELHALDASEDGDNTPGNEVHELCTEQTIYKDPDVKLTEFEDTYENAEVIYKSNAANQILEKVVVMVGDVDGKHKRKEEGNGKKYWEKAKAVKAMAKFLGGTHVGKEREVLEEEIKTNQDIVLETPCQETVLGRGNTECVFELGELELDNSAQNIDKEMLDLDSTEADDSHENILKHIVTVRAESPQTAYIVEIGETILENERVKIGNNEMQKVIMTDIETLQNVEKTDENGIVGSESLFELSLLEADTEIDADIDICKTGLVVIEKDVAELESDAVETKTNVVELKSGVVETVPDVVELETGIVKLERDEKEIEIDVVEIGPDGEELEEKWMDTEINMVNLETGVVESETDMVKQDTGFMVEVEMGIVETEPGIPAKEKEPGLVEYESCVTERGMDDVETALSIVESDAAIVKTKPDIVEFDMTVLETERVAVETEMGISGTEINRVNSMETLLFHENHTLFQCDPEHFKTENANILENVQFTNEDQDGFFTAEPSPCLENPFTNIIFQEGYTLSPGSQDIARKGGIGLSTGPFEDATCSNGMHQEIQNYNDSPDSALNIEHTKPVETQSYEHGESQGPNFGSTVMRKREIRLRHQPAIDDETKAKTEDVNHDSATTTMTSLPPERIIIKFDATSDGHVSDHGLENLDAGVAGDLVNYDSSAIADAFNDNLGSGSIEQKYPNTSRIDRTGIHDIDIKKEPMEEEGISDKSVENEEHTPELSEGVSFAEEIRMAESAKPGHEVIQNGDHVMETEIVTDTYATDSVEQDSHDSYIGKSGIDQSLITENQNTCASEPNKQSTQTFSYDSKTQSWNAVSCLVEDGNKESFSVPATLEDENFSRPRAYSSPSTLHLMNAGGARPKTRQPEPLNPDRGMEYRSLTLPTTPPEVKTTSAPANNFTGLSPSERARAMIQRHEREIVESIGHIGPPAIKTSASDRARQMIAEYELKKADAGLGLRTRTKSLDRATILSRFRSDHSNDSTEHQTGKVTSEHLNLHNMETRGRARRRLTSEDHTKGSLGTTRPITVDIQAKTEDSTLDSTTLSDIETPKLEFQSPLYRTKSLDNAVFLSSTSEFRFDDDKETPATPEYDLGRRSSFENDDGTTEQDQRPSKPGFGPGGSLLLSRSRARSLDGSTFLRSVSATPVEGYLSRYGRDRSLSNENASPITPLRSRSNSSSNLPTLLHRTAVEFCDSSIMTVDELANKYRIESVVDPWGLTMSVAEAVQNGIIDMEAGNYVNAITGNSMSIETAVVKKLIVQRKFSLEDHRRLREEQYARSRRDSGGSGSFSPQRIFSPPASPSAYRRSFSAPAPPQISTPVTSPVSTLRRSPNISRPSGAVTSAYGLIHFNSHTSAVPCCVKSVANTLVGQSTSFEVAKRCGIVDPKNKVFFDKKYGRRLTFDDAIEEGLMEVENEGADVYSGSGTMVNRESYLIYGVMDQAQQRRVSFKDAIAQGIIDGECGTYTDTCTNESLPIYEAISNDFLKAKKIEGASLNLYGSMVEHSSVLEVNREEFTRTYVGSGQSRIELAHGSFNMTI